MRAGRSARELIETLIGFDTTSARSNLALIDFVRGHLEEQGVAPELVFDDTGTKANLFASLGPIERPGIVLSGHTDVVPVDGQAWSSDPFVCVEREGRLYGRGSADMKGFLAAVLSRVPVWREARLDRPVHLAFSYDEEVGCKGVPRLLDRMLGALPAPPAGAVIGEPTMLRVVDGHKGKGGYRVTVEGRAGHSSRPDEAVNAIEVAAEIIAMLRRINARFRAEGPFADGFDPPHATLSVGTIEGGTAMNVVAERCRFVFECRTPPGVEAEAIVREVEASVERHLLPAMRAVAPEAGVVIEELLAYPALAPGPESEIGRVAREITATGHPGKAAFGTEAGHFAARGIPAVVCGPGDIAVAHKADEYLEVDQLTRCGAFLDRLVGRMARA